MTKKEKIAVDALISNIKVWRGIAAREKWNKGNGVNLDSRLVSRYTGEIVAFNMVLNSLIDLRLMKRR